MVIAPGHHSVGRAAHQIERQAGAAPAGSQKLDYHNDEACSDGLECVETDPQGYRCNLAQWSEAFAEEIAERDGIKLYNDHWEPIWHFRDYYDQNETAPTMHTMVKTLGKKNAHHQEKAYERQIYNLFPRDPIHEICKFSGLPMPQPDDQSLYRTNTNRLTGIIRAGTCPRFSVIMQLWPRPPCSRL